METALIFIPSKKIIGQQYFNIIKSVFAPAPGYTSFSQFKRAYGPAGQGMAWHHIVEQTPTNIERFGPQKIHNINNIVKLPHGKGTIHSKISAHYSSNLDNKNITIRKRLSTKGFWKQKRCEKKY